MADTLPLSSSSVGGLIAPPLTGLSINGYVVERVLSAGGMGVVYEARHPIIDRRAAVKVLRPEMVNLDDMRASFLREARALSAVRHRNVVEILNFGTLPDGGQYLMMELLEGEPLDRLLAREGPLPVMVALQYCEQILCGLAAAHAVHVVHRDLKPGNVVVTSSGGEARLLKVVDFGLAKRAEAVAEPADAGHAARAACASILAGTPEYICPEQAAGQAVTGAGDLYALGVMLFEMVTGRLPFLRTSPESLLEAHRHATPPRAGVFRAGMPPEVDALVSHLLQKAPSARPASADAARAQVLRIIETLTTRYAPTARLARSTTGPRTSRTLAVATALAVVGAVAAVSFSLWGETATALPRFVALAHAPPVETAPVVVPAPPVAAAPAPLAVVRQAAPATCDPETRARLVEQVDALEQLALARLPDDAPPNAVAAVRQTARRLSDRLRSGPCAGAEQGLLRWRAQLRGRP